MFVKNSNSTNKIILRIRLSEGIKPPDWALISWTMLDCLSESQQWVMNKLEYGVAEDPYMALMVDTNLGPNLPSQEGTGSMPAV